MVPFGLGLWTSRFSVGDIDRPSPGGDMVWPFSSWACGLATFQLGVLAPFQVGIWTGPFLVGDMNRPSLLRDIWSGPFLVGDVDWPLSS